MLKYSHEQTGSPCSHGTSILMSKRVRTQMSRMMSGNGKRDVENNTAEEQNWRGWGYNDRRDGPEVPSREGDF